MADIMCESTPYGVTDDCSIVCDYYGFADNGDSSGCFENWTSEKEEEKSYTQEKQVHWVEYPLEEEAEVELPTTFDEVVLQSHIDQIFNVLKMKQALNKEYKSRKECEEALDEADFEPDMYWIQEKKTTDGPRFVARLRLLGGMPKRFKSNGRKKKGRRDVNKDSRGAHTTVSRPVGAPDRMAVKLRFPFEVVVNNAASTRVSRRWHTNALYDVDPVFLSTTIPWFTEYSAMYAYNRVLSYRVQISLSNLEVFPVSVYFVHLNTDPGTGGVNFVNYANGPYGKQIQLASSNAQKSGITTMTHTIRQIVGDQVVLTEGNFEGPLVPIQQI